jgi:hypothetical protein
MGKMSIAVDAKGGGKRVKFVWEGDDAAIRNIMSAVEEFATSNGVTAKQLSQGALKHFPVMGWREKESERQFQMMTILYAVLKLPMPKNAGRPGEVHNYAADEDISATLTVGDKAVHAEINGEYIGGDRAEH